MEVAEHESTHPAGLSAGRLTHVDIDFDSELAEWAAGRGLQRVGATTTMVRVAPKVRIPGTRTSQSSPGPWAEAGRPRPRSIICQDPLENHTKVGIELELQHQAAAGFP